jgi:hypothetical protein
VESPLQLLAAYEAINYYNLDSGLIVIRLSSELRNDNQLSFLQSYLKFKGFRAIYVSVRPKNKKFSDFVKIAFYSVALPFLCLCYNNIVIGSFKSGFVSLALWPFHIKGKFIIVDDGTSTLEVKELTRFHDARFFTQFYQELANFVSKVDVNDFFSIRRRLLIDKSIPKDVIFIGSGIAEIGIVSESVYLGMVEKICKVYSGEGYNIRYIPHRVEPDEKLKKVSELANVEIFRINYPIELVGIIDNFYPVKVVSFYSTALVTMKSIYSCESIAYYFNYKDSKYSAEIDNVYDFMRKYLVVDSSLSY